MKLRLLTITLFSILAILPFIAFGQNSEADVTKLYDLLNKQNEAKEYDKAIETATKALTISNAPTRFKAFAHIMRAASLNNLYLSPNNIKSTEFIVYVDYTFKYSPERVAKLKEAIADYEAFIRYYNQSPTDNNPGQDIGNVYSAYANVFLRLGEYSTHRPAEFAKAEEIFRLSLANGKDTVFVNKKIIRCLIGQYKFNEARELAKKVLATTDEKDFGIVLGGIAEGFDSMGEYQFTDAFLLEQAGIRKASNKSLKPITDTSNSRRPSQKLAFEYANPTTATELNRKGALLAMNQQCDKALPLFEKSAAISENTTAARSAIPCLFNQKNYEFVWQISNGLVESDKNDVAALSARAILFTMQQGDEKAQLAKAEADLSKAISVFPELAAMLNSLDNAKKIYQVQNKSNKVSEMEALEKKLAALKAELDKADQQSAAEKKLNEVAKDILTNAGISDDLDDDDEMESNKPAPKSTPKPTPTKSQTPNPTSDLDGDGIPDREDVCPDLKGSKANKGCPGKDEPAPKSTPKPTPTQSETPNPTSDSDGDGIPDRDDKCLYDKGSVANQGCPGKDEPTPTPAVIKKPDIPALADCQFVIEDADCRKFYGKSRVELNSIFGEMPKNGSYPKLGIWFYMWSPSRDNAETVYQIKFYGKNIGDGTRFSGKPGKNLDWNASPSDVIKIYGKPTSQSEWTNSDKTVESAMGYGGDWSMRFESEKLVEITLNNPKHREDTDTYLEKEKQKYLEEKKTTESRIVQLRAVIDEVKKAHAKRGDRLDSEGEAQQQRPYSNLTSIGVTKYLSNSDGWVFVAISKDLTMTNISKNGEILEFPKSDVNSYFTSQSFSKIGDYNVSDYIFRFFSPGDSMVTFMPHGKDEGTVYWLLFRVKKEK